MARRNTEKPLDVAAMFQLGWMLFRPRLTLEDARNIREEGFDPSVAGPPPRSERPVPISAGLNDVVTYVFENYIGPLYVHPLASVLAAVEDELGSKLFVRPTRLLSGGIEAVSKFFLLRASRYATDPSPIAFYGTLYRMPDDRECRDDRYLIHRFVLAHEAMHHYLHIWPWLQSIAGDSKLIDNVRQEYRAFVDDVAVPCFGPAPDKAECEADLGALLTVLTKGYRTFRPRRKDEMKEVYGGFGMQLDVDQLLDRVATHTDRVRRPQSLADIVRHPVHRDKTWPDSAATDTVLQRLWRQSRLLSNLARSHPYAWVCRAIEDKFLPGKGEIRASVNVQIRILPTETAQPFLVIERLELASAFDEVNERLKSNPPHLVRFAVYYPDDWDIIHDPRNRIRLFQLLGTIEQVERRSQLTLDRPIKKGLTSYTDDERREALVFAIALDALIGDIDKVQRFTIGHANTMSGGIAHDLLVKPAWGDRVLSLLQESEEELSIAAPSTGVMDEDCEERLRHARREMNADKEWFLANIQMLRGQYESGYVAIHKQRVVDHSVSHRSLRTSLRKKFGVASLYVGDLSTSGDEEKYDLIGIRER